MLTDKESDQAPGNVTDELEIDDFVPKVDVPHRDQFVHHTHELPEALADATLRTLVRIVPLAYGVLLGALSGHMGLGLALGVCVSTIVDLNMHDNSVVRTLGRTVLRPGPPGHRNGGSRAGDGDRAAWPGEAGRSARDAVPGIAPLSGAGPNSCPAGGQPRATTRPLVRRRGR